VDTTLLMRLPSAPVGASALAVSPDDVSARFGDLLGGLVRERRYGGTAEAAGVGAAGGTHGEAAVTDAQRNLRLRHSVLRRLFDDPVVYRADLSEEELAYIISLTGRQILRRSVEQAGFVLEERADGFLLVDPDALATDLRFPDDTSTARVAALLLLEPVCAAPGGLLPEQLAEAGAELLRRFPQWAKAYQSEVGPARLADEAVRVLRDVGLVRGSGGRVVACPAAHRYRVAEAVSRGKDGKADEVTAAGAVASRQRAYARRVLRAGSAALISATTEMDNLTRVARRSAEELEQALAERESGESRRAQNPSILALALRRLGQNCPPLVCTSGWPNSAAIQLLRVLADNGAALRYHGDFDGEGIRIAAYVLDKTPANPWRMTAADYRAAVARYPHGPESGRITEAPWDPELAEAITEHGTAVVEELVAGVLLEDLEGAAEQTGRSG
jgi:hypothetical protein